MNKTKQNKGHAIYYSGPEGARVKVSPPFFVICIFRVLNFLLGYKALTRLQSLNFAAHA